MIMQMQYCSQHRAGRDIASPLYTTSDISKFNRALFTPSTKVLWDCPDLVLSLQQRAGLEDAAECLF